MRRLDEAARARLDAGQWRTPIGPFRSFTRSWTVTSDDPAILALVEDRYADLLPATPGAEPAATDEPDHTSFRLLTPVAGQPGMLVRGRRLLGSSNDPAVLVGRLVWGINRWVLDTEAGRRLLLHAGGVVDRDGRAVALPAVSEAGKSTLTLGLLERGWGYLSDEAIAIDDDVAVAGYAKPVSVDSGAWPLFERHGPGASERHLQAGQWQVRASAVSRVASRATLGAIVFPTYEPGAATTLTPVGPARKLRLAANSTFAADGGERITAAQLQRLATAIEALPGYTLVSSELDAACAAVAQVTTP